MIPIEFSVDFECETHFKGYQGRITKIYEKSLKSYQFPLCAEFEKYILVTPKRNTEEKGVEVLTRH